MRSPSAPAQLRTESADRPRVGRGSVGAISPKVGGSQALEVETFRWPDKTSAARRWRSGRDFHLWPVQRHEPSKKGPSVMIDHVSIQVCGLAVSAEFYQHILEPLGYLRLVDRPATVGFGFKYPELWLNARPTSPRAAADAGAHVCLRARSIDAVREFHQRAIAKGGSDDGQPGPRQGAMVVYYAAFIRDLDGNRVEVMNVPKADR